MSIQQMLIAGYTNLAVVDSADFDGTNDYMKTGAGLTGAADSKTGILSAWARLDGGNGAELTLINGATTVGGATRHFIVDRTAANLFRILGFTPTTTTVLSLFTVDTYTASATWLHVLSSWNLATSAEHLYINDVSDLTVNTSTDSAIDYTLADWAIGAAPNATAKFNGCLAEFYFAPGQYLDFSVEANRRKFISLSGKPVFLGADGSLPTGTAPLVYQHLDNGEAVANFALNAATGGDFTITGTLDTGSTSPSD